MLTSNDQLPLSPEEIVRFLVAKGMVIDRVDDVICMLTHVNAYRLRPYWLPFVRDRVTHEFWPTARFDRVIELYHFDKRLRALLLECLEPIEISLRANIARQVSLLHGPWAHEFRDVSYRNDTWPKAFEMLRRALEHAQVNDDSIPLYGTGLPGDRQTPQLSVSIEYLPFGSLAYWFRNLVPRDAQRSVSEVYSVHPDILSSWLRHLAVVRNIAAHHGRVWNRVIPFQPRIPRGHGIAASVNNRVNKVYNTLVIIQHLLRCVNAQVQVQDRLVQLVNGHAIRLSTVGFPSDWMERSIWKGA